MNGQPFSIIISSTSIRWYGTNLKCNKKKSLMKNQPPKKNTTVATCEFPYGVISFAKIWRISTYKLFMKYKLSNQTAVTICDCAWAMIRLTNSNICEGQTNRTETIPPPKRGEQDDPLFCECIPQFLLSRNIYHNALFSKCIPLISSSQTVY